MTWTKFDDTTPDHPKVVNLSDAAFRAWFNCICYCNRMLTDGFVPSGMYSRLFPHKPRPVHIIQELQGQRLIDLDPECLGFTLHDYLDYQPSKGEVHGKRDSKAMAGAKGAASRWHNNGNAPVPTHPVPLEDPVPKNPPNPPKGGRRRRGAARNDPVTSPVIRARIDAIEGRTP